MRLESHEVLQQEVTYLTFRVKQGRVGEMRLH
ncbi:hypothetical protein M2403_000810 [Rahnella sp. BIGb0603]|jgi:hypothetical protein|nr:hypothetical protein [Rahnella sp. BIGb0603]